MSAATFKATGSLIASPPVVGGLSAATIDLGFEHSYAQSDAGSLSVNSPSIPLSIVPATILSVRLVYLRVNSGTIKIRLTSGVGVAQTFNVSDEFLLHVPAPGDELSAVELLGVANVEYLVAGDAATPTPPPPTFGGTALQLTDSRERQTSLAGTEEVLFEWRGNFSDLPPVTNMSTGLTAVAFVTGGSGTVRVRVGGTPGAVDGAVVLTSAAITTTSAAALDVTPATSVRPTGGQQVKITGQNAAGQRVTVQGPAAVCLGV